VNQLGGVFEGRNVGSEAAKQVALGASWLPEGPSKKRRPTEMGENEKGGEAGHVPGAKGCKKNLPDGSYLLNREPGDQLSLQKSGNPPKMFLEPNKKGGQFQQRRRA